MYCDTIRLYFARRMNCQRSLPPNRPPKTKGAHGLAVAPSDVRKLALDVRLVQSKNESTPPNRECQVPGFGVSRFWSARRSLTLIGVAHGSSWQTGHVKNLLPFPLEIS